jgi:hypothetical protein
MASSRAEGGSGGTAAAAGSIAERADQQAAVTGKLQEYLDDKVLGYDAVLEARRRIMEVPQLLGGPAAATPDLGSMLSTGDGRLLNVIMDVSIGQNKVVSSTVDNNWRCLCRAEHSGETLAGRGGGETERVAVVLADHSYPAVWQCSGRKRCVVIIRIEHGILFDLVEELLIRLRGRYLGAGSVVMLVSATHMALTGTAGYCEDVMLAIRKLRRELGEHLNYTPLPQIFGAGCGDELTIREAVESAAWATHVFGRERLFLKRTFEASHAIIAESGEGGLQVAACSRYRLPARADGGNATATWYTDGLGGLPRRVREATVEQEKSLYAALVGELRSGMALDIDTAPNFDRTVRERAAAPAVGDGGYLVVGNDNAMRLHAAMQKCGKAATLIHLGDFRIIRGAGETAAERIRAAVAERRPAAIVIQLLDYTIFEALSEDGDKMPPRRIGDTIHLEATSRYASGRSWERY